MNRDNLRVLISEKQRVIYLVASATVCLFYTVVGVLKRALLGLLVG